MIQAMVCSSVPMSGAGMSRSGPMIGRISLGVAAGHALELGHGVLARVDRDAALGAAVRHVEQRALPGHPHRERAHLVEVDVGCVAQAALGRAAREVVLHAVADVEPALAVVHAQRHGHGQLAARGREHLVEAVVVAEQGHRLGELRARVGERGGWSRGSRAGGRRSRDRRVTDAAASVGDIVGAVTGCHAFFSPSARTSRPSMSSSSPMVSGGQEPDDVAVGAAGEHEHAVRGGVGRELGGERRVGRAGLGVDELDRDHGAAAADVADAGVGGAQRVEAADQHRADLASRAR